MDFLAEVYRSLSVLDGAILLISAKMAYKHKLVYYFMHLGNGDSHNLFINKIDQMELIYQRFISGARKRTKTPTTFFVTVWRQPVKHQILN